METEEDEKILQDAVADESAEDVPTVLTVQPSGENELVCVCFAFGL